MSNDSDDWASRFVTRLAQKHQATADANALLMHKRAMINSEAPYLWDLLRGAINERAGSVNRAAKAEYFRAAPQVQGRIEHTLESPAGHLALAFQHEVPIIKFKFTKAIKSATEVPKPVDGEMRFQFFEESVWLVVMRNA